MWLDVIRFIKDLFTGIIKEDKEKIEKVSQILGEMSVILLDVSDKLEKNEYPHYSCSLMSALTDRLYDITKNVIRVEEQDKFFKLLKECSNIERDYYLREELNTVVRLREVSAEIKALSMTLSVSLD